MVSTVVTVLRSGGDFKPCHVQALHRQFARWAPSGTHFLCLSDVGVPGVPCRPLLHAWPGWWAKLEVFRPDIEGDILFTDLDNVILGPLDDFLQPGPCTLQEGGWTALMRLAKDDRIVLWKEFDDSPEHWMQHYARINRPIVNGVGNYGDAGFISDRLPYETWEDHLPRQTINIAKLKHRFYDGRVFFDPPPADARIVLCGRPYRPWTLPMFVRKGLYGEAV